MTRIAALQFKAHKDQPAASLAALCQLIDGPPPPVPRWSSVPRWPTPATCSRTPPPSCRTARPPAVGPFLV